ncbi:ABC transporter permease [Actinomadura algeriensis]|uniref:ABC-type dipeptide/oligopeptide/nickel transport system permease subunit n=1 Tax=Actinomadura algeriensis TaxID=1679523 RepID=A0ABR9K057_9ACTN|nr:ABC transporter permease [Actinomadura algeriensis]MBE1536200.1 ABC-type dipeptide/oligopeptide/nickel transport system permease subunit [Actinomadura algeriensis]
MFEQEVAAGAPCSGRGPRRRAGRAARAARRSARPASARPAGDGPAAGPETAAGRTPSRLALARFRRDRSALAAAAVLLVIALFAALAPLWAQLTGHPYHATFPDTGLDPAGQPRGPGRDFWLGADQLGRDVLVRTAYGARISLVVGVGAAALAAAAGTLLGVVAGFCGGAVDTVLARLMDVTLALPYLLVAITLATTFPVSSVAGGLAMTILVVAFFSVASFGRVVRAQVLSLRRREFIEAARALGASSARIMASEVLPNLTAHITVLTSLLIPGAIVAEATLSFLGVGIRPPMPSWGAMLGEGGDVFRTAWWLLAVPGALLLLTTLAFNLLGEGIRNALDPRADAAPGGR